jgi:hypothetical protein
MVNEMSSTKPIGGHSTPHMQRVDGEAPHHQHVTTSIGSASIGGLALGWIRLSMSANEAD